MSLNTTFDNPLVGQKEAVLVAELVTDRRRYKCTLTNLRAPREACTAGWTQKRSPVGIRQEYRHTELHRKEHPKMNTFLHHLTTSFALLRSSLTYKVL